MKKTLACGLSVLLLASVAVCAAIIEVPEARILQIGGGVTAAAGGTVTQTGTAATFSSNANTGEQAVTVPSDATLMIVALAYGENSTNFASGGTLALRNVDNSDSQAFSVGRTDEVAEAGGTLIFYLVNPGTGSKELAWDWAGSSAVNEGAHFFYDWFKGVNTSTPIRGAGGGEVTSETGTATTGTLTASNGDYLVATAYVWTNSLDNATWTGSVTEVLEVNSLGIIGGYARGALTGNGSATVTHLTGNYEYIIITGIVLQP